MSSIKNTIVLLTLCLLQVGVEPSFAKVDKKHLDSIEEFVSDPEQKELRLSFYSSRLGERDLHKILTELLPEEAIDRIESLDISDNDLAELPLEIVQLKSLKILNARSSRISRLPSHFPGWRQLRNLDLSGNQLSEIPAALWDLPQLQRVSIEQNSKILDLSGIEKVHARMSFMAPGYDMDSFLSPSHCRRNSAIRKNGWYGVESLLHSWEEFAQQAQETKVRFPIKSDAQDFGQLAGYFIFDIFHEGGLENMILVCDPSGELRSIAYVESVPGLKYMRLSHLMSSPLNYGIQSKPVVKGAGRAALKEAIYLSLLHGFQGQLLLNAQPGSDEFYLKMGFKQVYRDDNEFAIDVERVNSLYPDLVARRAKAISR